MRSFDDCRGHFFGPRGRAVAEYLAGMETGKDAEGIHLFPWQIVHCNRDYMGLRQLFKRDSPRLAALLAISAGHATCRIDDGLFIDHRNRQRWADFRTYSTAGANVLINRGKKCY
jgi:hypothetical protein